MKVAEPSCENHVCRAKETWRSKNVQSRFKRDVLWSPPRCSRQWKDDTDVVFRRVVVIDKIIGKKKNGKYGLDNRYKRTRRHAVKSICVVCPPNRIYLRHKIKTYSLFLWYYFVSEVASGALCKPAVDYEIVRLKEPSSTLRQA